MPERKKPLDLSAAVTLNGSGNGSVTIGPTIGRMRYHVTQIGVQIPGTLTNVPQAIAYRGLAQPQNFIATTYDGNNDSTDCDVMLYAGQVITVTWTGGDAGVIATATIRGEQITGFN